MSQDQKSNTERVIDKLERKEQLSDEDVADFLGESKTLSENRSNVYLLVSYERLTRIIAEALSSKPVRMIGKNEQRLLNSLGNQLDRFDRLHAAKDKTGSSLDLNDESKFRRITHVVSISESSRNPADSESISN